MTSQNNNKSKVSILIPFEEKFNSYFGGAVARWINEVYSKINDFEIKVYGRSCNNEYDYTSLRLVSKFNSIFNFIIKIPYFRRLLGWVYCLIYFNDIKNSDIIDIHNSYKYVSILRKLGFKGKIVLHMHNDYLGNLSKMELDMLSKELDKLIVCSDFLRKRIKDKSNLLFEKSTILYNGFDKEKFYFDKIFEKNNELSIGYIGRIDFNKGLHLLLDVYENLLEKLPDLKLYVIGSSSFGVNGSSYEKQCLKKIEDLRKNKKANIEYLGYIHNKDLVRYYNKFKLFCSFSLQNEAFGMTYVESMACKTPVIAHDIGGVKEAVFFEEMLINDIDNINCIADKIYTFLISEEKYKDISEKSYNYVHKNFRWEYIATSQHQVLRELL